MDNHNIHLMKLAWRQALSSGNNEIWCGTMKEQSNYLETKRRNVRVLVVAVAVVVLIIAGFVAYFSSKWGDKPESARVTEHQFANSWVKGSRQAWVMSEVTEPAEYPLTAAGGQMVVANEERECS